jgi:Transposase DDE domain
MRNIEDPRQERLFDPFQGLFPPLARRILDNGWQGTFRLVILESLPVAKLSEHFHPSLGAPTKELYSMAGLVFLADFHGWTSQQAIEAYMFHTDVQFALNVEPGVEVCTRTVERYQELFLEDDLAALTFKNVTETLVKKLEQDVSLQRLDSTHVFSHMATFGRTKLMAVAIKRFLVQVKRHDPQVYAALPEPLRLRYELAQSQLFGDATDAETRQRSRQQAAEDLLWVIEHFADQPTMTGRQSYKALQTIFSQQCEVVGGKVTVRAKTGSNCMQNPSDPDATYDGHKGPGYQVQFAETCSSENEVQLITAALPQTACEPDEAAAMPILEQQEKANLLPEAMLADTLYTNDENVQAAAEFGVEMIGPVPGRAPESNAEALTVDDFAVDERTGFVEACPAGHQPLSCTYNEKTGKTKLEMAAGACAACPFRNQCPIVNTEEGRYFLEYTDKQRRLAARRREQETDVFKERYAMRSGIESTNSGLKNRLGLGRLRVRGWGSVFRVIWHKLAGWNVLRAAASKKLRAWVAERMARMLKKGESALFETCFGALLRLDERRDHVFRHAWPPSDRLRPLQAA